MGTKEETFRAKGAQSAIHEEIADIRQQIAELQGILYRMYVAYQQWLREREIDDIYCKMYELARIPERKKDRDKIYRAIQTMKNRSRNKRDNDFSLMDLSDMESRRNPGKQKQKYGVGEAFPVSCDYGIFSDSVDLSKVWHYDLRRNYEEY